MGLKRGDVVVVALRGDLGKPRPAIVVETDRLAATDHVLICPGTSEVRAKLFPRRIDVEPSTVNGLKSATQFQADKLTVTSRDKVGKVIGHLEAEAIERLNGAIYVMVGLAD